MIIQKEHTPDLNKAVRDLADKVNAKRRQELISIYSNSDLQKELDKIRQSGMYNKGNKSKSMRKIATIPLEVDVFFEKVYGVDYYKDPEFFKRHSEWLVVEQNKL